MKNIVIADRDYFPVLFQYKSNHPELNIKFVDLNEAIDELSFVFLNNPVSYLIEEQGIEYNKAKKIAKLLQCPDIHKNEKLNSIYKQMLGKYIPTDVDELALYNYKQSNILLFELDEHRQLKNLLNKRGLEFKDIHFSDLEFAENQKKEVINFKTKFDQFFYVFSNLRQELKNKSLKERNHYKILIENDDDVFYINYFSKLFGIEVLYKASKSLYTNKYINSCCKEIVLSKSFDIKLDSTIPEHVFLESLINEYKLKEIAKANFDFGYLNLLEMLKSKSVEEVSNNAGVLATTSFSFNGNETIYVTNFQHGSFYNELKDNNVISDKEIYEIGGNPSYVLTQLDKRKKLNFIKYLNIKLLSRAEQHLSDKIYDSQFVSSLSLKIINFSINAEPAVVTKDAYDLIQASRLDSLFYLEPLNSFRSYDHSFKGFDNAKNFSMIKKEYSVSYVKKYNSCPFGMLMEKLLPSLDEEKHQLWKGRLIHKVFENIYSDEFDYEESFKLGEQEYYNSVKSDGYEFTKKEEIIVKLLHYWLKPIAENVHSDIETVHFVPNKPIAKDFEFEVKSMLGPHKFHGFVDKILFTTFNNNKYYTIVDYKSGSHNSSNFDGAEALAGQNIQLPLYYKAISENNSSELDGYKFGGFGIKHNYGSTLKDAIYVNGCSSIENLTKNLKIEGLMNSDLDFYSSFSDKNVSSTNKIKAYNLSKSPTFSHDIGTGRDIFVIKFKKKEYPVYLDSFIKKIEQRVCEIIDKIEKNVFEIAPLSSDIKSFNTKRLQCDYCTYKDICYRKISDAKDLRKYIQKAVEELHNELQ